MAILNCKGGWEMLSRRKCRRKKKCVLVNTAVFVSLRCLLPNTHSSHTYNPHCSFPRVTVQPQVHPLNNFSVTCSPLHGAWISWSGGLTPQIQLIFSVGVRAKNSHWEKREEGIVSVTLTQQLWSPTGQKEEVSTGRSLKVLWLVPESVL